MIYDIFSYNGEADLLEMRLNLLDDLVDQFIICEAPSTFSGLPKPLYGLQHQDRFKKWHDKIKYYVIDENYSDEEIEQARISPHTQAQPRWMHEFLQKEALKKAMTHLKDNDVCYIGDVDEIWQHQSPNGIEKLKLRVYTYFINLRSNEEFWGPIRCLYKDVKNECLNDIRNRKEYRTEDFQGWHFTNQGGLDAVKQKVNDQYSMDFFLHGNENLLDMRFGKTDYIGRDFKLKVEESEWPTSLKENKEKYIHLCS